MYTFIYTILIYALILYESFLTWAGSIVSIRGVAFEIKQFLADEEKSKGKLGAYAMTRVAAGVHLPTLWLFEPAKYPVDRTDYCLGLPMGILG